MPASLCSHKKKFISIITYYVIKLYPVFRIKKVSSGISRFSTFILLILSIIKMTANFAIFSHRAFGKFTFFKKYLIFGKTNFEKQVYRTYPRVH